MSAAKNGGAKSEKANFLKFFCGNDYSGGIMAMLEFSTYIQNTSPEGFPAKLTVKIHMFGDWGYGPKGEKLVTPDLISGEEVDHYINRMIESLERVRIEAKAKLEENE